MEWLTSDVTKLVLEAQKESDCASKATLLTQFEGLLRRVSRTYRDVEGWDEAYQEACCAFLDAIRTYQPEHGPFTGYAAAKVHGDVRTAMRRQWKYQSRKAFVHGSGAKDGSDPDADNAAMEHVMAVANGVANSVSGEESMAMNWMWREIVERLVENAGLSVRESYWLEWTLKGKTTGEIAILADVGVETARTWRKRALGKLRIAAAQVNLTWLAIV